MFKKVFGSIFILSLALFIHISAPHAASTVGGNSLVIDNTSGQATQVGIDLQPAVTASGANAYGMRLQQTLTAAANSDALTGLYINPTFADNGKSSVTHNGLIVASGNVGIGTASPAEQLEITGNMRVAKTSRIYSGSNRLIFTPSLSNPVGNDYDDLNLFIGINAGTTSAITNQYCACGGANTVVGNNAFTAATTGILNTAVGNGALHSNTAGETNTAVGSLALYTNTTSFGSTAIGYRALQNSTGGQNTALGHSALYLNTTGNQNIAVGTNGLAGNTTGSTNTTAGYNSLAGNTTGSNNTALGSVAGNTNMTGSNNTFIGAGANAGSNNLSNATAVGYSAVVSASNSLVLGGTSSNAVNVGIGTTTPGAKLDIKDGHYASSQTTAPTPSVTGSGYSGASLGAGSTDTKGTITATVGGAAGTLVVTFNSAYASAPVCTATPATATAQVDVIKMYATESTTALTLNFVASPTGGSETYNYICVQ